MKKIAKVFFVLVLMTTAIAANAQKVQKFGHIDFSSLIQMMPGQDSINAAYETYAKGLSNQLTTMQAELENKQMDFQAKEPTMSNIIKQTKEKELQDLLQPAGRFPAAGTARPSELRKRTAQTTH